MKISKRIFLPLLFAGVAMTAEAADVTLGGWVVQPTCDIEVNNGVDTIYVGTYKSKDFVANQPIGDVPMTIALTNCTPGKKPGELMTGLLKITGNTADDNKLFIKNQGDTVGFMFKMSGTIIGNEVQFSHPIPLDYDSEVELTVGMASETVNPAPGMYSVPVTILYEVN